MESTYQGMSRMDWGLGGPNIAGAFIVGLLIAVWGLAYLHRHGFWVALLLFAVLEVFLIQTGSRGALLGAFSGLAVLLWFAPRPWPIAKTLAIVVVFCLGVGCAFYLSAHERLGQGIVEEDRSISNRLTIWKEAPKMLADAPLGWGKGLSGSAFMRWYQSPERTEVYPSLVNTHLTQIAEFGIAGGIFYVLLWLLSLMIAWPEEANRWRSVCLGVLIGFCVAATFTNMVKTPIVWIVPALFLIGALVSRGRSRQWPKARWVGIAAAISCVLIGCMFLIGVRQKGVEIKGSKDAVVWNGSEAETWVLVENGVLGKNFAKVFRTAWITRSDRAELSVGFASDAKAVPESAKTIVVAGSLPKGLKGRLGKDSSIRLLLLNPGFEPALLGDLSGRKVKVVAGDFSSSSVHSLWQSKSDYTLLPGVGDYMPGWPEMIFDFMGKQP